VSSLRYLLKRFSPYFKNYKLEFFFVIVGMILSSAGTTASAYIIKPVLDKIFIEHNRELLTLLPFGVVLVYAVKSGGTFLQSYYSAYIGLDIVREFRDKLLNKMLSFEMGFFHKYRSGELISRTINDIERIREVVSKTIPVMAREILTIVGLLGYVIYLDPKLAILSIAFIPLTAKPLTSLAKRMKRLSHSSQEKLSDITSKLSEIFNNIEIIKANHTQKYEFEKFSHENKKIFELNVKAVKTGELVGPMMEVAGSFAIALVIIYGGGRVIEGEMSVGSFFSFLAALFMLYTPIKRVSNLYNKMQDAIAASERIFSLIERDVTKSNGSLEIPDKIEKIEFKDVRLRYDTKEALKGIDFEANFGEKIALVGNSGGGKSSIVNLLLRFYDLDEGEISINSTDIREFKLESLRRAISIVTQRVYIFNDTVSANVAYGQKKIDEKKVIDSLKKANAWEFIKTMPKGIHTKINEFGTNLSGGQRQRIAIARAIYRDPKILIFDEATSALDTKSEAEISKALKNISKNKITFVIAHRLKTIEDADKIIVLKEGKIECIGKKSELLKHCAEFIKLNGGQM
jgi:subfamily B ATP-binding cassette protein MsbA